ncbi:aspartate--tRNA ligase, mitochondrial isoform X1 [Bradysia coprophila]|uniref:aspartate--tRNA ligase, mitochondrial isoform X1 n=2 Tax=Bradysia coprophila TaxID=38358 RepID=UPI00187DCB27|nr:aspartate--tRNA ligase, mitochondrial isoform X1 [Bradysia coprophila]
MLIGLLRLQNVHQFCRLSERNLFAGIHFAMNRNRSNFNDGPPRKLNRFSNPGPNYPSNIYEQLRGNDCDRGNGFNRGNNFNRGNDFNRDNFYGNDFNRDNFHSNEFSRDNFCPPNFDGNGFNRNCELGGPSSQAPPNFNRNCGLGGLSSQTDAVGVLLNEIQSLRSSMINFDGPPPPPPQSVNCGELRERHHGTLVEIEGKVNRSKGKFLELKDQHGCIQCVSPPGDSNMAQRFSKIPLDAYCTVIGIAKRRPDKLVNESLPTGAVEVHVQEIVNVRPIRVSREASFGQKRHFSTSAASCEPSKSTAITSNEYKRANGSDNLLQHFNNREHTSDTLRPNDASTVVSLVGWIDSKKRQNKKFLYLNDGYGNIQVVVGTEEQKKTYERLTDSDIILVKGVVLARPKSFQNKMSNSGDIEILAESIEIIDPKAEYTGPKIQKASSVKENVQMDEDSDQNNESDSRVPSMPTVNSFTSRTHTCGELTESNVGEKVTLCGWLEFHRMSRFFTLRDGYGRTQIYIPNNMSIDLGNIPFESILRINGLVLARPTAMRNPAMATGDIEVNLESFEVLNKATKSLPMNVRDFNRAKENLRMEFRYIDLRFQDMQRNLRLRSAVLMKMREYLCNRVGFVEVETPTLFRKTPGGAQEFIVPTQRPGKFYSLVQSPQQFKQMLMAGAIDRYFQIARCYRDETARPDRQPEFTQLDIELSFTDREHIMSLVENILAFAFPDTHKISTPFERITYDEAMEKYGSDKPDTRFGMTLNNVTSIIGTNSNLTQNVTDFAAYAIPFKYESGQRFHDDLAKDYNGFVKNFPGKMYNAKIKTDVAEWATKNIGCLSEESALCLAKALGVGKGDRIFIAFGPKEKTQILMGRVRLAIQSALEVLKKVPARTNDELKLLWVYDFPMFSLNESGQLESVHHPFTAPHPDDIDILYHSKNYTKIRSQAYDLVMNGQEIGGGSIRIHQADMQRNVLKDILNIEHSHLSHLIESLDSGCPPHGGIALGIDRLMAILCDTQSIRDVIAFPKGLNYTDPLSKAPVALNEDDLRLYHIDVRKESDEKLPENKD